MREEENENEDEVNENDDPSDSKPNERFDNFNLNIAFQNKGIEFKNMKGTLYMEPHYELNIDGKIFGFVSLGKKVNTLNKKIPLLETMKKKFLLILNYNHPIYFFEWDCKK